MSDEESSYSTSYSYSYSYSDSDPSDRDYRQSNDSSLANSYRKDQLRQLAQPQTQVLYPQQHQQQKQNNQYQNSPQNAATTSDHIQQAAVITAAVTTSFMALQQQMGNFMQRNNQNADVSFQNQSIPTQMPPPLIEQPQPALLPQADLAATLPIAASVVKEDRLDEAPLLPKSSLKKKKRPQINCKDTNELHEYINYQDQLLNDQRLETEQKLKERDFFFEQKVKNLTKQLEEANTKLQSQAAKMEEREETISIMKSQLKRFGLEQPMVKKAEKKQKVEENDFNTYQRQNYSNEPQIQQPIQQQRTEVIEDLNSSEVNKIRKQQMGSSLSFNQGVSNDVYKREKVSPLADVERRVQQLYEQNKPKDQFSHTSVQETQNQVQQPQYQQQISQPQYQQQIPLSQNQFQQNYNQQPTFQPQQVQPVYQDTFEQQQQAISSNAQRMNKSSVLGGGADYAVPKRADLQQSIPGKGTSVQNQQKAAGQQNQISQGVVAPDVYQRQPQYPPQQPQQSQQYPAQQVQQGQYSQSQMQQSLQQQQTRIDQVQQQNYQSPSQQFQPQQQNQPYQEQVQQNQLQLQQFVQQEAPQQQLQVPVPLSFDEFLKKKAREAAEAEMMRKYGESASNQQQQSQQQSYQSPPSYQPPPQVLTTQSPPAPEIPKPDAQLVAVLNKNAQNSSDNFTRMLTLNRNDPRFKMYQGLQSQYQVVQDQLQQFRDEMNQIENQKALKIKKLENRIRFEFLDGRVKELGSEAAKLKIRLKEFTEFTE